VDEMYLTIIAIVHSHDFLQMFDLNYVISKLIGYLLTYWLGNLVTYKPNI